MLDMAHGPNYRTRHAEMLGVLHNLEVENAKMEIDRTQEMEQLGSKVEVILRMVDKLDKERQTQEKERQEEEEGMTTKKARGFWHINRKLNKEEQGEAVAEKASNGLHDKRHKNPDGRQTPKQVQGRQGSNFRAGSTDQVDSNLVADLCVAMAEFASAGSKLLEEQQVLKSLQFHQIKARDNNISVAHAKTFEWIFRPSVPPEPQANFVEWLEQPDAVNDGLYWIAGKAGSGKSTLMKYIFNHAKTKEALRSWSQSSSLTIASYYFWNTGTTMQKSQEGLLRTLLYEIMRDCPELIHSLGMTNRLLQTGNDGWSRAELLDVFSAFKHHFTTSTKSRFCFFIDGLDEYSGDPRDLIEVLRDVSSCGNVKICVSSRPWQIFKQAYDNRIHRRFYLQDLTRGDIELFVRDKLESDPNFSLARSRDSKYQDLIVQIVEKAQGVFLWVVLVARSLLDGFTNADTIKTLESRLRRLPTDLEDLFRHMLSSVDDIYRSQMARTFQVALAAGGPLPLLLYSILDDLEDDSDFAMRLTASSQLAAQTEVHDIVTREAQMERRLDARSKGLLEITYDGQYKERGGCLSKKVDFLHRTVGDFLRQESLMKIFDKSAGPNFCSASSICHSILGLIKLPLTFHAKDSLHMPLRQLIYHFLEHAAEMEMGAESSHFQIIDEMDRAFSLQHLNDKVRDSIFEFCVQYGHTAYIKWKIENAEVLTVKRERPLLHHALRPWKLPEARSVNISDMIELLLKHGANPNGFQLASSKETMWQEFLGSVWNPCGPHLREQQLVQVKLLLSAGANRSVLVDSRSIATILAKAFGDDCAKELMRTDSHTKMRGEKKKREMKDLSTSGKKGRGGMIRIVLVLFDRKSRHPKVGG
jgi:hypothetical protein